MTNRKRVNIKAILTDPVLREELVEGAVDFICKVEDIRRDPLSPAAQAVLDAANGANSYGPDDCLNESRWIAAAALRAAADQVAPSDLDEPRNYLPMTMECQRIRKELLAIAAELEDSHA